MMPRNKKRMSICDHVKACVHTLRTHVGFVEARETSKPLRLLMFRVSLVVVSFRSSSHRRLAGGTTPFIRR